MLFNFRLFDVNNIKPLYDTKGHRLLSWYWLTLGMYWIDVGTDKLLRFTDEFLSWEEKEYPTGISRRYIDYQVSFFWEDLMEMIFYILETVPGAVL